MNIHSPNEMNMAATSNQRAFNLFIHNKNGHKNPHQLGIRVIERHMNLMNFGWQHLKVFHFQKNLPIQYPNENQA